MVHFIVWIDQKPSDHFPTMRISKICHSWSIKVRSYSFHCYCYTYSYINISEKAVSEFLISLYFRHAGVSDISRCPHTHWPFSFLFSLCQMENYFFICFFLYSIETEYCFRLMLATQGSSSVQCVSIISEALLSMESCQQPWQWVCGRCLHSYWNPSTHAIMKCPHRPCIAAS